MSEIEINEKAIETWALENKEKAKALGKWMVEHMNDKEGSPGTGEFEDAVVDWSRKNTLSARMLFLKLMPKIMS